MKRVLVLSDSLSLPREQPEKCNYEDTWPFLLSKSFNVHLVAIGGGTVTDLQRQLEYHKSYNPDFVVLQCGIVDCAPRAMGRIELELVKRFPILNRPLLHLIKKYSTSIRKIRSKTYTSPQAFEKAVLKIQDMVRNVPFYAIGILPTNADYEKKVPGITKRVIQFNLVLKRAVPNFISVEDMNRKGIMSDHIHLNPEGHLFVLSKINDVLK